MAQFFRELQNELLLAAKEFPAVTVFGPRQSGKTGMEQRNKALFIFFQGFHRQ